MDIFVTAVAMAGFLATSAAVIVARALGPVSGGGSIMQAIAPVLTCALLAFAFLIIRAEGISDFWLNAVMGLSAGSLCLSFSATLNQRRIFLPRVSMGNFLWSTAFGLIAIALMGEGAPVYCIGCPVAAQLFHLGAGVSRLFVADSVDR